MKLVLKILGYTIMICYFIITIIISVFVLKENEYGISKFNGKYFLTINFDNENDKYNKGDLVIVKDKELDNFKEGEEVFLYNSGIKNKVDIKVCTVKEVSIDSNPKYITVNEDNGYYRSDSIIGESIKKISYLGGIVDFLKDKIIFLVLLVIPAFILLVFELYLLIKKSNEIKNQNDNIEGNLD